MTLSLAAAGLGVLLLAPSVEPAAVASPTLGHIPKTIAVVALLLLSNVFSLAVTPALMAYTRYQEHESDRFGLEITHDNHAAATTFAKLQAENLGNPRPGLLYKVWRSSHPPLGERIDFCNAYRPWESGAPREYERLFRGRPAPVGSSGAVGGQP